MQWGVRLPPPHNQCHPGFWGRRFSRRRRRNFSRRGVMVVGEVDPPPTQDFRPALVQPLSINTLPILTKSPPPQSGQTTEQRNPPPPQVSIRSFKKWTLLMGLSPSGGSQPWRSSVRWNRRCMGGGHCVRMSGGNEGCWCHKHRST